MSTIRPSTVLKYRAIQNRYSELYNRDRLRLDDVEKRLCQEFFLSKTRVMAILKMDLPK